MLSTKNKDGTYTTTAVFIGEVHMIPKFKDHEADRTHDWIEMKGQPVLPEDYEWIKMESCECGGMRSHYSTTIEHQRVEEEMDGEDDDKGPKGH